MGFIFSNNHHDVVGKLTSDVAYSKIEKNEMGGSCGTYGGRERCA